MASLLKKLDEIVAEFGDGLVVRASGKEISQEFLLNNLSGSELFGERKLVVLTNPDEDFDIDKIVADENSQVVLVFDKSLGVRSKILKSARVQNGMIYDFASPQDRRIWSLLDMVLENDKKMIKLTADLLEEYGGQYLLTMFIFNLRRLVMVSSAPEFVRRKLTEKRSEWGMKKITKKYYECLETDRKIKSGLGSEKDLVNLMVINWTNQ